MSKEKTKTSPSSPSLDEIGKVLFGWRWRTPLAKELGVSPAVISRWRRGKTRIKRANWLAVEAMLDRKRAAMASMLTQLRKADHGAE